VLHSLFETPEGLIYAQKVVIPGLAFFLETAKHLSEANMFYTRDFLQKAFADSPTPCAKKEYSSEHQIEPVDPHK
jgi:hypothetical protein